MKYIRTKDGIENIENLFLVDYYDINGNAYKLEKNSMAATKIDYEKLFPNNKVADTIEELVDCYVIIDRDNRFPMTTSKEYIEFLDYKTNKDKANFDVYGAIWIDADLKSVAKMNSKGELELL